MTVNTEDEWLEADGLGGYASGTTSIIRTRRYHALLLAATTPPTGRMVLVNGLEVWVDTPHGRFALSSQRYLPGVTQPEGVDRIVAFTDDPWPHWTYQIPGEVPLAIEHELFVPKGLPLVVLSWRLATPAPGISLFVRPLLSGRQDHALHHENAAFRFAGEDSSGRVTWSPYDGVPAITALSNATYSNAPDWYRNFLYEEERDRGLDHSEDLAAPGNFRWLLSETEALLVFATGAEVDGDAASLVARLRTEERSRRSHFPARLARAGDAYLVQRGAGGTIIAGYPWFTDWGRDTFIALRGLCLATGRCDEALRILIAWAAVISEGMVPNRFPDVGDTAEYNSVDASLWYIVAVYETLEALKAAGRPASPAELTGLHRAVESILDGFSRGTRFGIHADADGLLAAGTPGTSLTWMDARVNDRAITPRVGKPVEVQALWINALHVGRLISARWSPRHANAVRSFIARFWNDKTGCLHDVIDVDHARGTVDSSIRPNQILAVGGLPVPIVTGAKARSIVDAVESQLLTPTGLRSLGPSEPGYSPRYEGGPSERDGAYHQGTVWPWLMGPFVEAWLRVRGGTAAARSEARTRFLQPLLDRTTTAGLGHVSEITDAEAPFTARGCPFQAWSVGEALRIERLLSDV